MAVSNSDIFEELMCNAYSLGIADDLRERVLQMNKEQRKDMNGILEQYEVAYKEICEKG
jgi:hypothetical protein